MLRKNPPDHPLVRRSATGRTVPVLRRLAGGTGDADRRRDDPAHGPVVRERRKIGESGEEPHGESLRTGMIRCRCRFWWCKKPSCWWASPHAARSLPGNCRKVFAALKQALDWLGAGAKTAAGYGRMGENAGAMASLRENAEQDREREADRLTAATRITGVATPF